jgi:hypothetical protein
MTKIYTNPARNKPEQVKKYTPTYQKLGITPIPVTLGGYTDSDQVSPGSPDNPRAPRPMVAKNFDFDDHQAPLQQQFAPMPHQFIDNQENFDPSVFEGEANYLAKLRANQASQSKPRPSTPPQSFAPPKPQYFFSSIDDGEYCVFVGNDPVASSLLKEEVEIEVEKLICGLHEAFPQKAVPQEMICVMRKMKMKTGISLE